MPNGREPDLVVPVATRRPQTEPKLAEQVEQAGAEGRLERTLSVLRDDPDAIVALLRGLPPEQRHMGRIVAIRTLGTEQGARLGRSAFGAMPLPAAEPNARHDAPPAGASARWNFARAGALADLCETLLRAGPAAGEAALQLLASTDHPIGFAALSLLAHERRGADTGSLFDALDAATAGGAVAVRTRIARGPGAAPSRGEPPRPSFIRAMRDVADRRAATLLRRESTPLSKADPDHPAVEAALSQAGSGAALPEAVRRDMEGRLGVRLDGIHLHADDVADRAAKALGARAFTVGDDIFFARGELALDTPSGLRLLAHELAHVRQARLGQVRTPSHGKIEVAERGDALESEAEQVAEQMREPRSPRLAVAAPIAAGAAPRRLFREENKGGRLEEDQSLSPFDPNERWDPSEASTGPGGGESKAAPAPAVRGTGGGHTGKSPGAHRTPHAHAPKEPKEPAAPPPLIDAPMRLPAVARPPGAAPAEPHGPSHPERPATPANQDHGHHHAPHERGQDAGARHAPHGAHTDDKPARAPSDHKEETARKETPRDARPPSKPPAPRQDAEPTATRRIAGTPPAARPSPASGSAPVARDQAPQIDWSSVPMRAPSSRKGPPPLPPPEKAPARRAPRPGPTQASHTSSAPPRPAAPAARSGRGAGAAPTSGVTPQVPVTATPATTPGADPLPASRPTVAGPREQVAAELARLREMAMAQRSSLAQAAAARKQQFAATATAKKQLAGQQVDAQVRRATGAYDQAVEAVSSSAARLRGQVQSDRDAKVSATRASADTEMQNLASTVRSQQEAVRQAADHGATNLVDHGTAESARVQSILAAKTQQAQARGQQITSQYAGHERAGDIAQTAQRIVSQTVSQLTEEAQKVSAAVVDAAARIADKLHTEAAEVVRQYEGADQAGHRKIEGERDKAVDAFHQAAADATARIDEKSDETAEGLRTQRGEAAQKVREGNELTDRAIDGSAQLASDQVDEGLAAAYSQLDQFLADSTGGALTVEGLRQAQQTLTRLAPAFQGALANGGSQVDQAMDTVANNAGADATRVADTGAQAAGETRDKFTNQLGAKVGEIGARMGEGLTAVQGEMRGAVTATGNELDNKTGEANTRWSGWITDGRSTITGQVGDFGSHADAALDRMSGDLSRAAANVANSSWLSRAASAIGDFFLGVLEGLWGALVDLFKGLVKLLELALKGVWWAILIVVILVVLIVVCIVSAKAALIILIIGAVIGVIAALVYLALAIFTPNLSARERGRYVGRALFEIILAALGFLKGGQAGNAAAKAALMARLIELVGSEAKAARLIELAGTVEKAIELVEAAKGGAQAIALAEKVAALGGNIERAIALATRSSDVAKVVELLDVVGDLAKVERLLALNADAGKLVSLVAKAGNVDKLIEVLGKWNEPEKLLALLDHIDIVKLAQLEAGTLAKLAELDGAIVAQLSRFEVAIIKNLAELGGPALEKLLALGEDVVRKIGRLDPAYLGEIAKLDAALIEKLARLETAAVDALKGLNAGQLAKVLELEEAALNNLTKGLDGAKLHELVAKFGKDVMNAIGKDLEGAEALRVIESLGDDVVNTLATALKGRGLKELEGMGMFNGKFDPTLSSALSSGRGAAARSMPPLQGKTLAEVEAELLAKGFTKQPGKAGMDFWYNGDGSLVRIKPTGAPSGPTAGQPHFVKEILKPGKTVADINDTKAVFAKVGDNGAVIPKGVKMAEDVLKSWFRGVAGRDPSATELDLMMRVWGRSGHVRIQ